VPFTFHCSDSLFNRMFQTESYSEYRYTFKLALCKSIVCIYAKEDLGFSFIANATMYVCKKLTFILPTNTSCNLME